jgi:hypothetical protein
MSIIIQPNEFRTCELCDCISPCKPKRLARLTDKFFAQILNNDQIWSNNLFENSFFLDDLYTWKQTNTGKDDWTWSSGTAYYHSFAASETLFKLYNGSGIYKLKFDVVLGAGAVMTVQTNLGTYATILTSGHYEYLLDTTFTYIGFIGSNATEGINLDNVTLQELNDISISDCCDNWIADLQIADYTFYDSWIDIEFLWSKYVSLQQEVKLCYGAELIVDGTFPPTSVWLQDGSGKTWQTDVMDEVHADLGVGESTKQIYQYVSLKNCEYDITFKCDPADFYKMHLYLNDELIDTVYPVVGTTSFTITFTPEYEGSYKLGFIAEDISIAGGSTSHLSNVSLIEQRCTDCFEIGEHKCSVLIEATNNASAYNLLNTFEGVMRIPAKMHKAKPQHTENIYRNTLGSYTNVFTDIALMYELETYLLHSDDLQSLILLLSFDNLYIDKKLYVKKEGNIEIDWDNKFEFGKFRVDLMLKDQLLQKDFL